MKFSSRHHPSAASAAFFPHPSSASFSRPTCRDRDVCKMGQLLRSPTCQGPRGTHKDCPLISYLEFISAVEWGRDVCNRARVLQNQNPFQFFAFDEGDVWKHPGHLQFIALLVNCILSTFYLGIVIQRDGRLRQHQAQGGAHRAAERLHAGGRRQAAAPRQHRQGTSIKDFCTGEEEGVSPNAAIASTSRSVPNAEKWRGSKIPN